jgi:nicotinamide-nucleotide amidase
MRACILSIGSEIMLGQITDTNASWLARDLADAGIELRTVMQVGDDFDLLLETLERAAALADIVICTGGIGPTDDDLTREVIARFVGETPEVDPDLLKELEGFFTSMGRTMPHRNRKQAWTIPSSSTLPNPVGTAPGWLVTTPDGTMIVAMPGVPREMHRMWNEQARPRVLEKAGTRIIDTVFIKTIGIGESDAEDRIHPLILAGDPQVATYAKDDGVHVRVTAVGDDPAEVRRRRDRMREEVYRILGPFIWGEDNDTLAGALAKRLSEAGMRLDIHEFGTGGGFAALLAADPAASGIFHAEVDAAGSLSAETFDFLKRHDTHVVNVVLAYAGDVDELGVSRGTLSMDVIHPSLASPRKSSWPLRGTLQEIQRRSALNAVYELNSWLTLGLATRS